MKSLKIWVFLGSCFLFPNALTAQLELGFDGGVSMDNSGGVVVTSWSIPVDRMRIGVRGGRLSFETLFKILHQRSGGRSATLIEVIPGIAYSMRGGYLRGEAGMSNLSTPNGTASQYYYGIATGARRQLHGPVHLRIETGLGKWVRNVNFLESKVFRFTVGLSVVFN